MLGAGGGEHDPDHPREVIVVDVAVANKGNPASRVGVTVICHAVQPWPLALAPALPTMRPVGGLMVLQGQACKAVDASNCQLRNWDVSYVTGNS